LVRPRDGRADAPIADRLWCADGNQRGEFGETTGCEERLVEIVDNVREVNNVVANESERLFVAGVTKAQQFHRYCFQ
jgi:hypothetical protein